MPLSPAASIYLRLFDQEVGFLTLQDVVAMVPKVNLTKDGLMQMAMKVRIQIRSRCFMLVQFTSDDNIFMKCILIPY